MTTLVTATGSQPVARRRTYGRYVGAKLLGALGSLVFVLVVNFFLFRVLPGDPARTLGRGRFRTPEALERFREQYGLDQPLWQQFLTFLKNTLSGDLGISLRYRVPVSDLILDRMWPTILLVGTSTLLAAADRHLHRDGECLEPRPDGRPGLLLVVAHALLDAGVVARAPPHRRLRGRDRAVPRGLPDRWAALGRRRPLVVGGTSSTPPGTSRCRSSH